MKTLINRCLSLIALLAVLVVLPTQAQVNYDKITYIHSDASGTPIAASDEQGDIVWSLDHYPYGAEYSNDANNRAGTLSFAGKAYDEETGLSYFGGRWYNAHIGRFMGIDPVGVDPQDWRTFNRYSYGFNNPYKYVDPDGNLPVIIVAIAVFVAKEVAAEVASRVTNGATDFLSVRRMGTKAVKAGAKAVSKSSDNVTQAGKGGIVNRGGRFADLDKAKGLGEVGHHMPQNAFNKTNGLSRSDGPAVGMTTDDHALTRTFAGKGKASMRQDAGLNARQRLAKDIHDLRSNFGTKYNKGSLEAIQHAKTLKEFQK